MAKGFGTIEATFNHEYNTYDGSPAYLSTNKFDQTARQGSTCDCEGDEHDGREPDVEDEPSLGWTAAEAGLGCYSDDPNRHDDREDDAGDDREIENEHRDVSDNEPSLDWTEAGLSFAVTRR